MTPEQQALIERLYENESLTDNLTDADARALLKWAEEQIRNETDGALVTAAVSNANQSGAEGAQALLSQASTFLTEQLRAREADAARAADEANVSADAAAQDAVAQTASLSDDAAGTRERVAPSTLSALGVTGESGTAIMLSAAPQAVFAPAQKPPAKKRRRSSKRKKK